jgi:hypothetical protein
LPKGFFHGEHNYNECVNCGRLGRPDGALEDSIAYLTTLFGNGGKRLADIVDFFFSASTNGAHATFRQGQAYTCLAGRQAAKKALKPPAVSADRRYEILYLPIAESER